MRAVAARIYRRFWFADRIVEIAIIKVLPDGSRQVKRKLINPQMAIPKSSSRAVGGNNSAHVLFLTSANSGETSINLGKENLTLRILFVSEKRMYS